MEERRVGKLKDVMDMIVTAQQSLVDDIVEQEKAYKEAVAKVNGMDDIQNFLLDNKTGLQPPRPTEYEAYKGKHEQFKKKSVPAAVAVSRPVESTPPSTAAPLPTPGGTRAAATPTSRPQAKALFEYAAADATELGFGVGDIITVTKQDDSGWWEGECHGKAGMFPGNYVELIKGSAPAAGPPPGEKRCVVSPPSFPAPPI